MAETSDRPSEAGSEGPSKVRPLGSLSFFQFRLVFVSFVVGFVGFQMRQATNLWFVYQLTESPLSVGLLGAFQFAPMLVLVFVGGSLADMVDRRTLLIVTQASNLVLAIVLAVLTLTDNIAVWHIYVTTLVIAAVNSFEGPARMAMLPRLIPRSHFMNAITLNQAGRHSSMMFGPALGGLLLGLVGPGWTYVVVGAIFLPVVVALFFVTPMPPDPDARRRGLASKEMLAGFKFVFSTHILLAMMVLDVVAMLFTHHRGLVPVFTETILDAPTWAYGLMLSAPAFGFLIGSALLLIAGDVKHKGMLVIVTYMVYMGAISVFAVSRNYLLSWLALAFVGGLDGVGAIMRSTILQLAVADEIRGRATAVMQLSNRGGPSMGQIFLGLMATLIGAPNALLMGAVIGVITLVIVMMTVRGIATYQGEKMVTT